MRKSQQDNTSKEDRTVQYSTAQHSTAQYSTVQHSTVPMTYVADGMSLALRNCKVTRPSLQPIKDRVRGFSVNPNHHDMCNNNRRLGLGIRLRLGLGLG